ATVQSYLTGNVPVVVIGFIAAVFMALVLLFGKQIWRWARGAFVHSPEEGRTHSNVQFYERLISLMEQRGLLRDTHLTPLEFAKTLKSSVALLITRAYNRVRFGGQRLSDTEKREVERALSALERINQRS
ncbi:MAG TPA: DUF4129 domain-containing protein, partial [Pyrinomonadaceae bacterium]|nr:DUF4129 domain-containing protein [Pyrinomonadaceae bacterium]